jgi:hypothetical protein
MKNRMVMAILPVIACFAFLPAAQGQPGCFANFTTAAGCDALSSLTTGTANSGLGWRALFTDSTGSFNTGVGGGALIFNNADSNTAVGAAALLLNTTGSENTATGTDALVYNDSGSHNTADGAFSLSSNVTGSSNTASGFSALAWNVDGIDNTAAGDSALGHNTSGGFNTAVGVFALLTNTDGSSNTAVGQGALGGASGSNSTALGYQAAGNVTTADNVICIGANVAGANVSDTCFIGNIRDVTTQNADAIAVVIDSAGQLGTLSSSRRFKEEIKSMDEASEAILALKPVTFHYKRDKTGTPQFGLIAEEVAAVNPHLVVRDKNGDVYTVRYEAVNAMLLNEFLKEHRKVEQLQTTIDQQQKGMEMLTAQVKEQAAQIQKVSTQLEISKPEAKVVVSKP